MSVQELRARIQKLSSEIELQKKLLNKLERDKCLVQRQLNAVLDPVARLPLEISSEIFLQSLAPIAQPGARHLPMLLLNVCHAWADIALSTPALWAAIDVAFPCSEGFQEVLKIWLRRARNRPLSMSLRGDLEDRSAVAAIIWQPGQQLRNFEICVDTEDDEDGITDVDLFRGMSPGSLPLLETLTIRGVLWRKFYGPSILQLISRAPNLRECSFHEVEPVYLLDFKSEKVVLPNLRRLMFGPCLGKPTSDDDILGCLSLPALEALSVSLRYVSGHELLSFLERSSPPLQELVVGDGSELVRLHDLFHLLPGLTSFEIWGLGPPLMTELFAVLADSPVPPPQLSPLVHPQRPGARYFRFLLENTPSRTFRPS
ncbi:F-box domain-containing protein [Mycena venus]|uniref:F-box domain-containing protein n=1 Tax=Mycena venus TaxID=2733690 RepID=A0A8H6U093_9AGAR|nr:F-box domain-containing protein [Mycena venus]